MRGRGDAAEVHSRSDCHRKRRSRGARVMTQVLRSLDQITTGYTVFEENQVLTDKQLNSVADYFDDQTRLTRVQLLGVGIVCGLRPSVLNDLVRLSKGVGVTTDGDLLSLPADTTY